MRSFWRFRTITINSGGNTTRRPLVSQTCLSRAILSGVSLESILPQIARAVRHHFQAKFVALGTPGIRPVFAEGWDGPPEWRAYA